MRRVCKFLVCFLSLIFLFGCVGCKPNSPEDSTIDVRVGDSSIEDIATFFINVDETAQLVCTSKGKEITVEYIVSEEAQKVINIDSEGNVTGKQKGNATVYVNAKADDGEELQREVVFYVVETRTCKVTAINIQEMYHYTNIQTQMLEYGSKIILHDQSDSQAYTFLGWTREYGSGEYITEIESLTEDITIYAEWQLNKYQVTYELSGGNLDREYDEVEYNTNFELPVPQKDGYEFLGWAYSEESKNVYDRLVVVRDVTLYAQWKIIE